MGLRKGSKKKATIGLDIDPSHIAAAEVHVNGAVTVTRGAVAMLPAGVMREGELADGEALAHALRDFFEAHDLPRRVRLGMAHQRIVVRTVDLPPLTDEKALAAAVRVEAPDHIPMPIDEAVIDFQPLGIVETADGPRARVVVVAARKEMVERLVEAARSAGLQVEGIDLSAFGMVRALAPAQGEAAKIYVNLAGLTNVAVANHDGCLFTRAATGGYDAMVNALCERRGLIPEHARQWMQHVGLTTPLEEVEGEEEVVAATRAVLQEGVHHVADTVRNSLNFFRMQEGSEKVASGILIGPAAGIDGFAEQLGDALRLPVEIASLGIGGEQVEGEREPHRLTVAAGLAVDEAA